MSLVKVPTVSAPSEKSRASVAPEASVSAVAAGSWPETRSVPAVTSDAGGLHELIEHGQNGYRARTGDIEAMAQLALDIVADPATLQRFRAAARRRVGNPLRLREQSRDPWSFSMLETFVKDVRHALRLLRRDPAFTVTALATLALGIGLNTAIFSVAYGVLWRPLPYSDSDRLVMLSSAQQTGTGVRTFSTWAPVTYEALRSRVTTLDPLAAYASNDAQLTGRGEPLQVRALDVSPNFFATLGVAPARGRAFLTGAAAPDDEGADDPVGPQQGHDENRAEPGSEHDLVNRRRQVLRQVLRLYRLARPRGIAHAGIVEPDRLIGNRRDQLGAHAVSGPEVEAVGLPAIDIDGARLGEIDLARAAIEQAHAHAAFQLAHAARERGRRDIQGLGGVAEVLALGDLDE